MIASESHDLDFDLEEPHEDYFERIWKRSNHAGLPRNNRTRYEAWHDIIEALLRGDCTKNQIMHRTFIQYQATEKYLDFLLKAGLIIAHLEQETKFKGSRRVTFSVTQKGREFHRLMGHLLELQGKK